MRERDGESDGERAEEEKEKSFEKGCELLSKTDGSSLYWNSSELCSVLCMCHSREEKVGQG